MGAGYAGDIAVDDVRIEAGACPHIGSCTFENDLCGYFNPRQSPDDFNWLRNAGKTDSSNTGPPVDHTTNSDSGTGKP